MGTPGHGSELDYDPYVQTRQVRGEIEIFAEKNQTSVIYDCDLWANYQLFTFHDFFYILNFIYTNKPIYHLQNTKPRNMLVSFFKSYCFEVLSATALKIPQTYHKSKVVGLLDFFIDIFFLSLKFRIKIFFFEACAISKQLLCVCLAKFSFLNILPCLNTHI